MKIVMVDHIYFDMAIDISSGIQIWIHKRVCG